MGNTSSCPFCGHDLEDHDVEIWPFGEEVLEVNVQLACSKCLCNVKGEVP